MADIPATMRSLVAPKKCKPAEYELRKVPTPRITGPKQVLLRMHAAAYNPGDAIRASGSLPFLKAEYPMPIGAEGSGVVVAIGSEVTAVKVGDAVYGCYVDKPFGLQPPPGFMSEYAVAEDRFLLRKPAHLSFEEAAALPGSVATADQTIRRALQLSGEASLEGKTVFVPAGLSATGSVMIQVARNVFGAGKIITTVSTAKVPLVEEHLPGMVDQVIDYKTQRVRDHVAPGSVDFAFNTQFATYDDCLLVLRPRTGTLLSIASVPSRATATAMFGPGRLPWWAGLALDCAQLWYAWKAMGTGIRWEFLSGSLHVRELLERMGEIVALGKVRAVTQTVGFDDVDEVKARCEMTRVQQGGIGKMVVKIC